MSAGRVRTIASYGLLVLAVLPLWAEPLVLIRRAPLTSVCVALTAMFLGSAWLAMSPEPDVRAGAGRPLRLFVGRFLLAAGLMTAVLFGAVLLGLWAFFIPPVLSHSVPAHRLLQPNTLLDAIMVPLMLGGIPCAIACGVAAIGRGLIKAYRRSKA